MKENILKDRSFQFSLAVIKVYKQVSVEHKEYVLTKQLVEKRHCNRCVVQRSGTCTIKD